MDIDPKLREYCDRDRQREIFDAYASAPNITQAAKLCGADRYVVTRAIKRLERRAAQQGYGPRYDMTKPVAPGFGVKGTSTLYDQDGEVKVQWVKTHRENTEETLAAIKEAVQSEIRPVKPAKTVSKKQVEADTLAAYCIGDAHIGMLSWGDETGEDFDLEIAERDLMAAADRLIDATPPSDEALVCQFGDWYHTDSSRNATPMNNNPLDTDSRFPNMLKTGIRTLRYIIDQALKKHRLVRVRNVAGNHDMHSHLTLTYALAGYYEKEPRVVIEESPKAVFYHRFGKNLIGITHGHAPKPDKLPGVMAVDSMQDWGECEFKYIWHGHIHNKRVFEEMGCIVESFRTLAAADAWTVEQGYRAGREMQAIVLHKDYGEVERHTAGIKLVRA